MGSDLPHPQPSGASAAADGDRLEQLRLVSAVVEYTRDAVLVTEAEPIDEPGPRIVYANPAFLRETGYTWDEVVGRSPRFLQGPGSDRAALDRIRQALQRWQPVRVEVLNYKKDGSSFWAELDITPLADPTGWYTHWIAIQRDITQRKQVEAAERQRARHLDLIVRHYPGMVARVDRHLRYLYASPRYEEWFGEPAHALLGRTIADVIGPHAYAIAEPFANRALAGELVTFENQIILPTGRRWWVSVTFVPVTDADDPVPGFFIFSTDITRRRQAEEALRAGEERLRLAVRAANIGLWDWDVRTDEVVYSPEWKAQLGYAEDEIRNDLAEWEGRVHPDDRGPVLDRARRTITGPESAHEVEFRMRHKDGSWRWIFARGQVLRDAGGVAVRMLGCHLDVTERKQAEAALRESERRFRELLEKVQLIAVMLDADGRITFCNEHLLNLTGWRADEVLGLSWFDLFLPDDVRAELWRVFFSPSPREEMPAHYENEILTRSGHRRLVSWSNTVLRDAEGRRMGTTSIGEDVTERKRSEEALQEREARLAAILDTAADAVITIDRAGMIESVNQAAERMFGYPKAELIGRNVSVLMPPPHRDRHDGYIARYIATGQPRMIGVGRELSARRKDGTEFPIELAVSQIDHRRQFTGIVRDVSLRKNLEREVVRIASLEQQRIGQDLHDGIGQELTALGLLADGLVEVLRENSPQHAPLADRIERRVRTVLRQVRGIARGLAVGELTPGELPRQLAEMAARLSESGGVRVTFHGDPPRPQ